MQTPVKKTSGKANRKRGHDYECSVARFFRQWFPHVVTSRSASRLRDGEGIDLCHSDELKHGRFPFNIQCKSSCDTPPIVSIMERIKDVMPLIFWSRTERAGGRMMNRGEYVIMRREDFDQILEGYLLSQNLAKRDS